MSPIRRRAVAVVAGTWALVWVVMSPVLLVLAFAILPKLRAELPTTSAIGLVGLSILAVVVGAAGMALKGAITGAAFALLLGRHERGRRAEELSTGRMLLWSNVAGALWTPLSVALARLALPGATIPPWQIALSLAGHAVLVSVSALATRWLVQRGDAADHRRALARPLAPDVGRVGLPSGAAVDAPIGAPSGERLAPRGSGR